MTLCHLEWVSGLVTHSPVIPKYDGVSQLFLLVSGFPVNEFHAIVITFVAGTLPLRFFNFSTTSQSYLDQHMSTSQ